MFLFITISVVMFLVVTTIVGHFALQKAALAQTMPARPAQAPVTPPSPASTPPVHVVQPSQPAHTPARRTPTKPRQSATSTVAKPSTRRRNPSRKNSVTSTVSPAAPEPMDLDKIMMPVDADDPDNDFQVLDESSCLNFDVPDYMNIDHDSMDESTFSPNGSGNDEDI